MNLLFVSDSLVKPRLFKLLLQVMDHLGNEPHQPHEFAFPKRQFGKIKIVPILFRALGSKVFPGSTMTKGLIQLFASCVEPLYSKRSYCLQIPAKWMEHSFQPASATGRMLLLVLGSVNPVNVIVLLLN